MPELRRDPIVGRWVIIATERAKRPSDVPRVREAVPAGLCPFCPGHEDKTPREVYVSGRPPSAAPNGPGWKVRVVPNRYPALMIEGDLEREANGIYDRMNGIGAHEVIIESADHSRDLGSLTDAEVTEVLFAFKARTLDLRNDMRFRPSCSSEHGSAAG
jgi:UDPglucose--hexose-1-phosphate uridylyltransferase